MNKGSVLQNTGQGRQTLLAKGTNDQQDDSSPGEPSYHQPVCHIHPNNTGSNTPEQLKFRLLIYPFTPHETPSRLHDLVGAKETRVLTKTNWMVPGDNGRNISDIQQELRKCQTLSTRNQTNVHVGLKPLDLSCAECWDECSKIATAYNRPHSMFPLGSLMEGITFDRNDWLLVKETLFAAECLTQQESADLWEGETSIMAQKLLERGIRDDTCFIKLIGALNDYGMELLVERFQHGADSDAQEAQEHEESELQSTLPKSSRSSMSRKQILCLKGCHVGLLRRMDSENTQLLDVMLRHGVITAGHCSTLRDIVPMLERNYRLLNIVYSRPARYFSKFQQCLKETGQKDLADLLKI